MTLMVNMADSCLGYSGGNTQLMWREKSCCSTMTHGLSSQHKIPIRFAFLRLQGDGELARRTGGNMVEDRIGMIQALSLTSA